MLSCHLNWANAKRQGSGNGRTSPSPTRVAVDCGWHSASINSPSPSTPATTRCTATASIGNTGRSPRPENRSRQGHASQEAAQLSVGDHDPTDDVVRAMCDESEAEAFERGLSAPTGEGSQLCDAARASLELDGGQQGARDASASGLGVNEHMSTRPSGSRSVKPTTVSSTTAMRVDTCRRRDPSCSGPCEWGPPRLPPGRVGRPRPLSGGRRPGRCRRSLRRHPGFGNPEVRVAVGQCSPAQDIHPSLDPGPPRNGRALAGAEVPPRSAVRSRTADRHISGTR